MTTHCPVHPPHRGVVQRRQPSAVLTELIVVRTRLRGAPVRVTPPPRPGRPARRRRAVSPSCAVEPTTSTWPLRTPASPATPSGPGSSHGYRYRRPAGQPPTGVNRSRSPLLTSRDSQGGLMVEHWGVPDDSGLLPPARVVQAPRRSLVPRHRFQHAWPNAAMRRRCRARRRSASADVPSCLACDANGRVPGGTSAAIGRLSAGGVTVDSRKRQRL